MERIDRQSLIDLKNSRGWEVLVKEFIDVRVEELDNLLLNPDLTDIIWDNPQKQLNLLNQKKIERAYLVWLKNKPDELINSFI